VVGVVEEESVATVAPAVLAYSGDEVGLVPFVDDDEVGVIECFVEVDCAGL
jgi:hypothetical protein